jgi:hypothetical protein
MMGGQHSVCCNSVVRDSHPQLLCVAAEWWWWPPCRLDMTVEETLQHTESAYEQLQKYYDWVKGNRWLMIKVFVTLIIMALIFVMFVQ